MTRVVSANALKAVLSQETGEVFLICLTITQASIPTIYVVNNNQSVVRTAGTFLAYPFQTNLPDEDPDSFPQVTLVFDNIDPTISQTLLGLTSQANVAIEVILASSPNTVELGPLNFILLMAVVTAETITMTLGLDDDVFSQNCPGVIYSPSNSPGLF